MCKRECLCMHVIGRERKGVWEGDGDIAKAAVLPHIGLQTEDS